MQKIGVYIYVYKERREEKRREREGLVLEKNVYVRGRHGGGILEQRAKRRHGGCGCGGVKGGD